MSTDKETGTTSLTFPSDAVETALDDLPADMITDEAATYARECAAVLDGHHYGSGRSPSGLAAATIYLAAIVTQSAHYRTSQLPSQEDVAEHCDVSPITIREHYRTILEIKKEHDAAEDDDQDHTTVGELS